MGSNFLEMGEFESNILFYPDLEDAEKYHIVQEADFDGNEDDNAGSEIGPINNYNELTMYEAEDEPTINTFKDAEFEVSKLTLLRRESSPKGVEEEYVEHSTTNCSDFGSMGNYNEWIVYEPEDEPTENNVENIAEGVEDIGSMGYDDDMILYEPEDELTENNRENIAEGVEDIGSMGYDDDMIVYEPEDEPTENNLEDIFEGVEDIGSIGYDDGTIIHEAEDEMNHLEDSDQVVDTGIINEGRPNRGRKRKVPNQSRADRKRLCNTNKMHINSKGNVYQQKVFDEHFECNCQLSCTEVVPIDDRRRLFSQFWSQGNYEGRASLLMACMSKDLTKNRENARIYSIYERHVCLKTLLKTLQISDSRIPVARKKYLESNTLSDLRGKLSGGWNALPLNKTDEVRAHINSFPKYVSHYAREKTESKYLNSDLNLAKLYALYKEEANDPVSQSFYNRVFYDKFNLRFKQPKMDTCHKCDIYMAKKKTYTGSELEMLEEWHEAHLESGERLQGQMKADLAAAENNDKLEACTYDIQKTLQLLKVPTSISYYKRQMSLYNLGIHTGSTGKGKFNLWVEDEASKGTQEVGSCLKMHIESITKPMEELFLWSDSCGGQNRSIKLVLMMMYVLQNHATLKTISMRYLLSGHSFLPNDPEFGEVETAIKKKERLFTDKQYVKLMENCRARNKFEVNRMSSEDFFSVRNLESLITNRKVDVNKEKISWLDTHEILLEKNQPNIIKMSKKIGGPYQTVNLQKAGRQLDLKDVVLGSLWPTGRPLSNEKIKDIRDMLNLVPEKHLGFFVERLNRVHGADFIDDIDGFGESIDFDVEWSTE